MKETSLPVSAIPTCRHTAALAGGLYSAACVTLPDAHHRVISSLVKTVNQVVRMPTYREAVLEDTGETATHDPGTPGAAIGFDFHLTETGPKLIEINTNAGGALLSAGLFSSRHCQALHDPEEEQLAMFAAEWRAWAGDRPLKRIALVDDVPDKQPLKREFALYRELFKGAGWETVICDPAELTVKAGRLTHVAGPVDLVYNRLTDFSLKEAKCQALCRAYLEGLALITPHPHAHALLADKARLALLGDRERMLELGLSNDEAELLATVIPRVTPVTPRNADKLWVLRRKLYFKPVNGFGSRGVYNGAKLTRKVWGEIVKGGYVAQETIPPSLCEVGENAPLKLDLRAYAYQGQIQHYAARLFRGQTLNFKTPGGGFAPVVLPSDCVAC